MINARTAGRSTCGSTKSLVYRFGHSERDGRAGEADMQCALLPCGADVGADKRNQRYTETEHQRYQEIPQGVRRCGMRRPRRPGDGCGESSRGADDQFWMELIDDSEIAAYRVAEKKRLIGNYG
jgi:hypothetical protein